MTFPLPLTRKQLVEVVKCYGTAFPEWKIVGGDRLVRTYGPILQQIGFEALRSGDYRPVMGVRPLPLPTIALLHQFLDIKHRETLLRQHADQWKRVVSAMEQQFRPSVRAPLDLLEVRDLCEERSRAFAADFCMLAILSAYVGDGQKALWYCERIGTAAPPTLAPKPDWERSYVAFGRELHAAIEAGNERQFIDDAAARTDSSRYTGKSSG